MPGSDGPTALFDFGFHPEVLYARLQQQAVQDDNIFNQSSRNSVETTAVMVPLFCSEATRVPLVVQVLVLKRPESHSWSNYWWCFSNL